MRHFLRILNKRVKDIQRFYHKNWNDYRASQMMRAKEKLIGFCKENHRIIARQLRQSEGEGNRADVSASRHIDDTINRTDVVLSPEVRERDNSKESVRTGGQHKKERIRTESSQNSQEYSPMISENIPALILKEPSHPEPSHRAQHPRKISPQQHHPYPQPSYPQHHSSKPDSPKTHHRDPTHKTPPTKISPNSHNKPKVTHHTSKQTHHKPMANLQIPSHTAPQSRGKSLL